MRCLIQRSGPATVSVDAQTVGHIDHGLVILVCAMHGDTEAKVAKLAQKISKLRIFRDAAGRMNRSVLDQGGAALVVSQFTLAADTTRGNRPGFSSAAPPELGEALYLRFCDLLTELGVRVETGCFGADMKVELVNDGPVTIWMDTET